MSSVNSFEGRPNPFMYYMLAQLDGHVVMTDEQLVAIRTENYEVVQYRDEASCTEHLRLLPRKQHDSGETVRETQRGDRTSTVDAPREVPANPRALTSRATVVDGSD